MRFIDGVIGRPTIVGGLSSGGVLSAWLSAYAKPGQVIGAYYEDPPLFSSEVRPAVGQGIRQAIGPIFAVMAKYLGDQWSIGDWDGMIAALPTELPGGCPCSRARSGCGDRRTAAGAQGVRPGVGPGVLDRIVLRASCDHERMLRSVKVPVLFTHHFRMIDEATGALMGATSDLQAARVRQLVTDAGQPFEYVDVADDSALAARPVIHSSTSTRWSAGRTR